VGLLARIFTLRGEIMDDYVFPEAIETATLSPWIGIPLILLFVYIYREKIK